VVSDDKSDMMDDLALLGCFSGALPRYNLPSKEKSRIISHERYHAASGTGRISWEFAKLPPGSRIKRQRLIAA